MNAGRVVTHGSDLADRAAALHRGCSEAMHLEIVSNLCPEQGTGGTMTIRQELQSMSPRKLAMRFLTLSDDQRREYSREFFSAPGVTTATADGVAWQVQGAFGNGAIQALWTAKPTDPTTYILAAWVSIYNGDNEEAPGLFCQQTAFAGITRSGENGATGGVAYTPLGPLAPTVTAMFVVQLDNGQQSATSLPISTETATR
jgi:hypothetical protein